MFCRPHEFDCEVSIQEGKDDEIVHSCSFYGSRLGIIMYHPKGQVRLTRQAPKEWGQGNCYAKGPLF